MTLSVRRSRAPQLLLGLVVACGCGHSGGGGGFAGSTNVSASSAVSPGSSGGGSSAGSSSGSSGGSSAGSSSVMGGPPPGMKVKQVISSIASNFNGTPIGAGGDFIWFNAVFMPKNVPATGATFTVTNATVTFAANGVNYDVHVPDATIYFSPTATQASTNFNSATSSWDTIVPIGLSGNTFLAGVPFQVPTNLPGGINPVTWTGTFGTDVLGLSIQWQWAAAVYTSFSPNPSSLGVKSVDDSKADVSYKSSDHAGTPENFAASAVGGARGGGAANATGSYSGTANIDFTGYSACGCP